MAVTARQATSRATDEARHELFLEIIDELQDADLEEVSRLTKRWGRRGVSVPTLYAWRRCLLEEHGTKHPNTRTLFAVADALGYDLAWVKRQKAPVRVLRK